MTKKGGTITENTSGLQDNHILIRIIFLKRIKLLTRKGKEPQETKMIKSKQISKRDYKVQKGATNEYTFRLQRTKEVINPILKIQIAA